MGDRDVAIRDELGRVLASDAFVASPMLAAFLRYVVEETLAGRSDRLKAYTIAVGALARDERFDPNDNPLVRVQARRLRQALAKHYATAANPDGLRIELPLGSYVPVFVDAAAAPPSPVEPLDVVEAIGEAPAPVVAAPRPSLASARHLAVAGLAIGVVFVGAVALWISRPAAVVSPPPVAERPTAPPLRRDLDASRVLPLLRIAVTVRNEAMVGFDAEIYRNRLEAFAQRFDDTIVVTRRSTDFPNPPGQPLYLLSLLIAREGASTNAYWTLVHAGDDRIVKSGALDLQSIEGAAADALETPPDLALVRDLVQLHGAISQDVVALPDVSPELDCLARAWRYYLESTAQNHLVARTCLEATVADDPRLAPAQTMLGAMYMSEFRQGFGRTTDDSIDRAESALRKAVQVAPTSSAPYQTWENLLLIKGDVEAAALAGKRAVELNPEDMNAVGNHGSVLARSGRYEEALPLLRRAAANMTTPPKWLQYYAFLALNNLGRAEEADRYVAFFEGTRSSLYLTAVAIRAHRRGDAAGAADAFARIVAAEPDFGTDPRAFLRRRGFADVVVDRLMIDLERAGFGLPPPK
ncbi:MAG: hypothetical protein LWW93_14865 [Hyphomicrobiales bacterium]|nr:hypothetical protein [Hyphomicrobiales bacterium]